MAGESAPPTLLRSRRSLSARINGVRVYQPLVHLSHHISVSCAIFRQFHLNCSICGASIGCKHLSRDVHSRCIICWCGRTQCTVYTILRRVLSWSRSFFMPSNLGPLRLGARVWDEADEALNLTGLQLDGASGSFCERGD